MAMLQGFRIQNYSGTLRDVGFPASSGTPITPAP